MQIYVSSVCCKSICILLYHVIIPLHADILISQRLNFIDAATGSLGQGLSIAAGMAYVGKYLDKSRYYVRQTDNDRLSLSILLVFLCLHTVSVWICLFILFVQLNTIISCISLCVTFSSYLNLAEGGFIQSSILKVNFISIFNRNNLCIWYFPSVVWSKWVINWGSSINSNG